ncbi:aminopeptidase P N-terminal domain-containing protein [candidate division KSB1 bacterium]
MNIKLRLSALCLLLALLLSGSSVLYAQSPEELRARRAAVMETMEPNSILILRSAEPNGGSEQYRQDNNFYYLTGIMEEDSHLILRKGGQGRPQMRGSRGSSEVLFIRAGGYSDWDPETLGLEGAKEKLGFENVLESSEFDDYLGTQLLGGLDVVYIDYNRSRSIQGPLTADEQLFKEARDRGATFTLNSSSGIINPKRRIKSSYEIEELRMAINITAEAHKEAMRSTEPGMFEYQTQAVIEYVYALNGAVRPGFSSIVGSGPNSVILHWSENSRKMESGDLIVIDIGAEYHMYTGDITRTIPVNGKFTPHQREIYEIVLEANESAIEMIAPGVNWSDVTEKANQILSDGLIRVGLIENRNELRTYYFHGLGHPIGLQVHDVGGTGILEPGMIMTIEPGLYIREEGLGVRIEDDVLVTETGYEVLSVNAPKKIEDVERIMSEKGLDFSRYLINK